jgi:hypothetical protein
VAVASLIGCRSTARLAAVGDAFTHPEASADGSQNKRYIKLDHSNDAIFYCTCRHVQTAKFFSNFVSFHKSHGWDLDLISFKI